jgi:hypothetical protein
MRAGGLARWVTSLYGFFNHVYQRQYQMAWRAADTAKMAMAGDIKGAAEESWKLAGLTVAYVILPALIEEAVSPLTNEEHESLGTWAFKTVANGSASSVPVVRDIVHSMIGGHDASIGLFDTAIKDVLALPKDMQQTWEKGWKPKTGGQTIQAAAELAGVLTGFPMQAGKTAKFYYNYTHGREHPHDLIQQPEIVSRFTGDRIDKRRSMWGGLRYGTAETRRQR